MSKQEMAVKIPFISKYQRHITLTSLFCYQLLMFPMGIVCLFGLLTLNWYILAPVLIVCVVQFPARKSETFIKFVKKYIKPTSYFKKFTRIAEQKIDQNQKVLYGFHPHSIFSISILLNMNTKDPGIPDFTGLGSRFGFNAPLLGLLLRLWGCSTVECDNIKSLMEQRKNIGLVPGGYEQASLTTTKQMRLYLNKRKGFIKYALRYGYTIRPVLNFGENKAFETLDLLSSIKLFLNKFKLPTVFFLNKTYLFFIDPNIEITTVIGKGIKREEAEHYIEPTIEQIDKYHGLYVDEVKRIYNKYKHLNDNKPLVIM